MSARIILAMPTARATHEPSRKRLGLAVGIAIALAGCDQSSGPLRIALARDCMAHLPAGPVATHYNDWDEVVDSCDMRAWREAAQCEGHEAECFAQLKPAQAIEARRAETGTGQTVGMENGHD